MLIRCLISALAAIVCVVGTSAQVNTDRVMRVGQTALYYEDYLVAISHFNRVIESKPYLAQPYLMRAIAKLNLDDYNGALDDATKAIELNPFIPDAYEVRGIAAQNMGRTADAIADYSHELTMLPENRNILFNMALAQEEIGDHDGARQSYDRLIKSHPGYENGYVGRAKLNLATGDTVAAVADLDKALSINRNIANAYTLRASIAIDRDSDFASALNDLDEAIRLQPKQAGLYINRAYLRYKLNDYRGAFDDYEYAVSLDPLNSVAYYNRGLLRSEVSDYDKAIADFSRVLDLDPGDYRSLYNRAMAYADTGKLDKALADIDHVIALTPDIAPLYFFRSSLYERLGNLRKAATDYDHGLELSKLDLASAKRNETPSDDDSQLPQSDTTPEQLVANLFNSLLTVENKTEVDSEYNNKNIRGKVQDHDIAISLRPLYGVIFATDTDEPLQIASLRLDDLDMANTLLNIGARLTLAPTGNASSTSTEVNTIFGISDKLNQDIADRDARPVDYFARAISYMSLHDYDKAIDDLNKVLALTPGYTPALLSRALARQAKLSDLTDNTSGTDAMSRQTLYNSVLNDLDTLIATSPRMAVAYYDKGTILAAKGDYATALQCYDMAISLAPDMGDAYYNRAFVQLKQGNREGGVSDLSRAGQLGVVAAYNLLKRINR